MKIKVYFLIAATLAIVGTGVCFLLFKTGELTVLNPNPYEVVAAVRYERSSGNWETGGWFKLRPGERKKISATFFNITPNFYVYAESYDEALIRWLPNDLAKDEPATVFFISEDSVIGQFPKDRTLSLDSENSESDSVNAEFEDLEFSRVNMRDSTQPLYILADPFFQNVIWNEQALQVKESEQAFEVIKQSSETLAASLKRQYRFDELFKKPEHEYPFLFEFEVTDGSDRDNEAFMRPGILITRVDSETIHGDPIQLKTGDILIRINDTPIYAPSDAYMELYGHALDEKKGITHPLQFTVRRGDEVLQIQSYYLFNPSFPWGETKTSAFWNHAADSASLGFWPQIKAVFTDESSWQVRQRLVRLKQFYPSESTSGAVAGFFVPSPLTLLRLGKVARGGRALSAVKTAALIATFELAELAIYTINTAPPTRTTEEILLDIQSWAPATMAIGLVSGVFEGGGKPTLKTRNRKPFGRFR